MKMNIKKASLLFPLLALIPLASPVSASTGQFQNASFQLLFQDASGPPITSELFPPRPTYTTITSDGIGIATAVGFDSVAGPVVVTFPGAASLDTNQSTDTELIYLNDPGSPAVFSQNGEPVMRSNIWGYTQTHDPLTGALTQASLQFTGLQAANSSDLASEITSSGNNGLSLQTNTTSNLETISSGSDTTWTNRVQIMGQLLPATVTLGPGGSPLPDPEPDTPPSVIPEPSSTLLLSLALLALLPRHRRAG